jgi:hypothetical protein
MQNFKCSSVLPTTCHSLSFHIMPVTLMHLPYLDMWLNSTVSVVFSWQSFANNCFRVVIIVKRQNGSNTPIFLLITPIKIRRCSSTSFI